MVYFLKLPRRNRIERTARRFCRSGVVAGLWAWGFSDVTVLPHFIVEGSRMVTTVSAA